MNYRLALCKKFEEIRMSLNTSIASTRTSRKRACWPAVLYCAVMTNETR
jgi:hypothetical protein